MLIKHYTGDKKNRIRKKDIIFVNNILSQHNIRCFRNKSEIVLILDSKHKKSNFIEVTLKKMQSMSLKNWINKLKNIYDKFIIDYYKNKRNHK